MADIGFAFLSADPFPPPKLIGDFLFGKSTAYTEWILRNVYASSSGRLDPRGGARVDTIIISWGPGTASPAQRRTLLSCAKGD